MVDRVKCLCEAKVDYVYRASFAHQTGDAFFLKKLDKQDRCEMKPWWLGEEDRVSKRNIRPLQAIFRIVYIKQMLHRQRVATTLLAVTIGIMVIFLEKGFRKPFMSKPNYN